METHNDIGIHMETEKLISINQACEHLGISRPYIYRLINEKKLPYYVVGTLKRFKVSELDEWAKSRNK
jgi:excisionase family DNA binding protein